MPKRQALNQLTKENWDEEEETELPGTFKKLSEENLSNRVIKQARRKSLNSGNTMQSNSPFASFKGFGNKVEVKTSENGDANPSQHGNSNILTKQSSSSKPENSTAQQKNDTCRDLEYYHLLKCLNESLVNWVTQHLTKNPLCDFTPVFSDYKKHLEDLEAKFPIREDDKSATVDNLKENSTDISVSLPQPSKPFESSSEKNANSSENNRLNSSGSALFGNFSSAKESTLPAQNIASSPPLFNISKSVVAASNTAVAATSFQFGNMTNCSPSKSSVSKNVSDDSGKKETSLFTIPVVSNASTQESKPFSFSSAVVQSNERKKDVEESEENVEPPKNDFTPVVEEDAVYSKRCKLFYNKEGQYIEKGIGTLYIKPWKEKMLLVVRADTSLGHILLNISLNSCLPVKRVGKNNVLIVCIPYPPIDPSKANDKTAVPMLIRVKTEEDANELFKKIEELKTS